MKLCSLAIALIAGGHLARAAEQPVPVERGPRRAHRRPVDCGTRDEAGEVRDRRVAGDRLRDRGAGPVGEARARRAAGRVQVARHGEVAVDLACDLVVLAALAAVAAARGVVGRARSPRTGARSPGPGGPRGWCRRAPRKRRRGCCSARSAQVALARDREVPGEIQVPGPDSGMPERHQDLLHVGPPGLDGGVRRAEAVAVDAERLLRPDRVAVRILRAAEARRCSGRPRPSSRPGG